MVQSVVRAIRILEVLDRAQGETMALGALAGAVGLKTPTAHNLLKTLTTLGYVEQATDSRGYALGGRAGKLGQGRSTLARLIAIARPLIDVLRDKLGETVIVAVYRDGLRHTVLTAESPRELRVGKATGVDARLLDTATGRVLLSRLDSVELSRVLDGIEFPTSAWPGVVSREGLDAALRTIRKSGFAATSPPDPEVRAAAVPIQLESTEALPAALGVYYPANRPPVSGLANLRNVLAESAAAIALAAAVDA